jgi:arylformamidase
MDWGMMSRAERDAAYNNGTADKNADTLRGARDAASVAFRRRHPRHLDQAYGPRERNKWDLFPAADPNAPCIVFLHGGYWHRNGREQFASVIAGPVARGWAAALPGYTLAPEVSLTEIVAEIHAALDWLADNGAAHGISGKVVLSGWSAGGHLTAMCLGHRRVSAGLAVSGVYELGPMRDTPINDKVHLSDDEIVTLSPLRLPMVSKPLAIAYGTAELPALVNDARKLHARRAAEHLSGALIPLANASHFATTSALHDPDGALTRHIPLLLD